MNVSSTPVLSRLVAMAALVLTQTVPVLQAADAAPGIVVAKPAVNAPVSVAETTANGVNYYIISNGIVTAWINKTSGDMEGLDYKGVDLAGHDQPTVGVGSWEQTPANAAQVGGLTDSITIDPAKNGGERAEVSVKAVTGGQVGLTPNAPGAPGGGMRMDLEIRYSIGRGESGVYTYAIFSHPAGYPAGGVGAESRYILLLNQSFDWLSADADRNLLAAGPLNWGTGVVVHAKEQRIMSQGPYENSVEHKYSYNGVQFKIPAYGWSSTKEHVGVWFINPTTEYLSGGATKLELQTHYGDNGNPDPIILDYWKGSHYGRNTSLNVAANENWSHVVGPIFVYVNSLDSFKTPSKTDLDTLAASLGDPTVPAAWKDNATALFQNALEQAKLEKAKWPYEWVNGVDYPHKDQRGSVAGQLVLNDVYAPKGTPTTMPHLTVGLAAPEPSDNDANAGANFGSEASWVTDGKNYQFWANGTEDGKFTIDKVRPGNYTLHAFADGVLGEFARTNVTIEAGKSLDLGQLEWKPIRYGTQVWEIGYPDRSAREFFKGDGDNYWLWGWPLRYPLLFPNDLTYTVGQSDPKKDWFFEEVPHATADPSEFLNPAAKDPANQRFGWVKSFPEGSPDPWRSWGQGQATTWTIKFNMDKAPQGYATFRIALSGADGAGGTTVGVNGENVGPVNPFSTNALRYNTDQGVWQERDVRFDASLLKPGENKITITVPAGDLDSGLVYDYLRLELNEYYKLDGTPLTPPKS
jgi:rhamnogalacturonan endolyase